MRQAWGCRLGRPAVPEPAGPAPGDTDSDGVHPVVAGPGGGGAHILGIHLQGPPLAQPELGAQARVVVGADGLLMAVREHARGLGGAHAHGEIGGDPLAFREEIEQETAQELMLIGRPGRARDARLQLGAQQRQVDPEVVRAPSAVPQAEAGLVLHLVVVFELGVGALDHHPLGALCAIGHHRGSQGGPQQEVSDHIVTFQ